jgi:hypothetical protein
VDIDNAGAIAWTGANLALSDSTVYFAGATGLQLIDVSDPRKPTKANMPFYAWPTEFGVCHGGSPVIVGDYAYVGVNCYPMLTDGGGGEGEGTGGLAIYRVRASRARVCGGECVDVTQHHRHCGRCDQPCSAYQKCIDGACAPL